MYTRKLISEELMDELKHNRLKGNYRAALMVPLCVDDIRYNDKYIEEFYIGILVSLKMVKVIGGSLICKKINGEQLFSIRQCITDMIEINEEFVDYCIEDSMKYTYNLEDANIKNDFSKLFIQQKDTIMFGNILNQYMLLFDGILLITDDI